MSVVGKRDGITFRDLIQFGKNQSLAPTPTLNTYLEQIALAISRWPDYARQAKVSPTNASKIETALSVNLEQMQAKA